MKGKQSQDLPGKFEQLSTEILDEMLQVELQKETPDPEVATGILGVLQEREKDMPLVLTDGEKAAWQKYLSRRESVSAKPRKRYIWALRAACIVAILGVCLTVFSDRAVADGFWNRIARWTDSVIEFFSPGHAANLDQKYEFRTNHPGLQQVYDAVTRLGVKTPVVPMWLPEGYELVQCRELNNEKKTTLMTGFKNGQKVLNYTVAVYFDNVVNQYQKDAAELKTIEINNIEVHVVQNYDMWVAVWTVDNTECSISVDCHEGELYKILYSIYDKEEAE